MKNFLNKIFSTNNFLTGTMMMSIGLFVTMLSRSVKAEQLATTLLGVAGVVVIAFFLGAILNSTLKRIREKS
jgi:hypothetical protein